ncbi:conserved hypothetical protein [Vibrio chagasii]|uniref:Uncharacterized protein n=1 Tax=Vibrio coralliirubri TaxID=1516159 RepID=A0AA86WQ50_9VIBR|nr:conserved hypothetical protein [Vibrio chagasii]CDT74142.1 hypothetical protein VCR31J2_1300121 [Vibrio coralliirubri]CDT91295.1 hypothetical protein VCR29J2_80068 [Vibrio coralliirubri]
MSKLQQLDVSIDTNTKIGRLILPVGMETHWFPDFATYPFR